MERSPMLEEVVFAGKTPHTNTLTVGDRTVKQLPYSGSSDMQVDGIAMAVEVVLFPKLL